MYFENADGNYVYAPDVSGLGGIMEPFNPMDAPMMLGASYQQSPLLPGDMGTPTFTMDVGMPDYDAQLSGFDWQGRAIYGAHAQFEEPMLGGFGAVQDAVSVLSFVDLLARA